MSTMESNKKMKHDSASSSSSTKRLSKLQILTKTDFSLAISWKVPDFPQFNDQYLVSGYFPLRGFRFRFHMFSKEVASENTSQKYLGLYLEIDDSIRAEAVAVCCKVTMYHVKDIDQSVSKYLFRRYIHGMKPNAQGEFAPFGSLEGSNSEFLLNGTDLYIHGDILILDDEWIFDGYDIALPQEHRINFEEFESIDAVDGVYEGKFTWTLKNYSLLQERFKHNGMLGSAPFPIGQALYHIHLETRKRPLSEDKEDFLSLILHSESVEGEDKSSWIVLQVEMRNKKLRQPEKICTAFGRLGFDLRWLYLMKMSEFEEPDNGWHVKENDTVELILWFSAMEETVDLTKKYENSKTIWDFGATASADSSSTENKKEFFEYSWTILNFFTVADHMKEHYIRDNCGMKSRRIRLGEIETRLVIFPWGIVGYPEHVGLYLENMNSSKRPNTLVEDETSLLVHFALGMNSSPDSGEQIIMEQITRFHKDREIYGYPDFVLQSYIYRELDGDVPDESFLVTAKIHVLEETVEMENLMVCTDGVEKLGKQIRWEVDDFISTWGRTCERNKSNLIESSYIKIREGFCLCISIAVCNEDGILYGGLRSDGEREGDGQTHHLSIQLAVLNQKNLDETQWKQHTFWLIDKPRFNLAKLSDLLKEDAGYIVKDKVVFGCKINRVGRYRLADYRKKKAEEEGRS